MKPLSILTIALVLAASACSDDPADSGIGAATDAGDTDTFGTSDTPDADEDITDLPRDTGPDAPPDTGENNGNPGGLCAQCLDDDDCGGPNDLCTQLPFEDGMTCGIDCTVSESVCPADFECVVVEDLPVEIRNCLPENRVCNDLCDGVTCDPGQVCIPTTGACEDPLGLCGQPCVFDDQCGGADDRCVFLRATGERVCGQVCISDEETGEHDCPEDYFCARINAEEGEFFQCVPEILTCVDRCSDVVCEESQVCDPFSGFCTTRLGQCDLGCDNNALCGETNDDICLSFRDNADNESFCALGCDDAFDCPINYFCGNINGRPRGACVPIDLTCIDRCRGLECPEGTNCDVRQGECVVSELGLCDDCGELDDPSCGGQMDRCLNLGDPAGVICSEDCTETGECPNEGYRCVILRNSTLRVCIPIGGDCLRCQVVDCDGGTTCNPLTGECVAPAISCNDEGCENRFVCNPDNGECELIGEACTFETRFDCFGPVRKCSATRPGQEGVCAVICGDDDDCPTGAPHCTDLYRVGELCVPDGLGGPTTCGNTAPDGVGVGRPCGAGVAARCPQDAPECIQGIDAGTPGFCSASCQVDADCGGQGTCQALRGRQGQWCTPPNCLCLAGNEVSREDRDILQEALDEHGLGRCSFSLNPFHQGFLDPEIPGAPLRPEYVGSFAAQPLSSIAAGQILGDELATASVGARPTRDALIIAAARAGYILEARDPDFPIPDELPPLVEGLRRVTEAAGGEFDIAEVNGVVDDVPIDLQDKLAQILFAASEVIVARQGAVEAVGLTPTEVDALFTSIPYLFLIPPDGVTPPNLDDPAVLATLEDLDLQPLFQATADLAAVIEAASLTSNPDYDAVSISLETPVGAIIIGAAGDTVWDRTEPIAVAVDVSGNDRWSGAAGATATATQPLGLVIDLGGDDVYGYTEVPNARDTDAWLPSDAGGRLDPELPVQASHGPISLSDSGRQGSGRLGAGLLYDLGDGDDRYTSLRMSQGVGILGVGVLFDGGGNDIYTVEAFGQGAGLLGIGVFLDRGGDIDRMRIWHAGQGFGTARGVGIAIDTGGDNVWLAEPATGIADVLYFSFPDRGQSNQNLAQGMGAGLFPPDQRFPDRQPMGGGMGVLFDLDGDDTYTVGTYGIGAGVHHGMGFFIDAGGADVYVARYGAVGFGHTVGVGTFLELGGDDVYLVDGRVISSMLGHGSQLGAGVFTDFFGDERYQVPSTSGGVGTQNGAGVFFDLGGADDHTALSLNTWGYAAAQFEDETDPRRDLPTYGLFIDASQSEDIYTRIDLEDPEPPLIGDDLTWTQRANPDLDSELGVGIDGDGLTGYEIAP
jgi:hypothetical protein